MTTFEQDLAGATADIEAARQALLDIVTDLYPPDLQRRQRGGWSVAAILLHVVEAERHYARGLYALRGAEAPKPLPGVNPATDAAGAADALTLSRSDLTRALRGIDEETFYRLMPLTNEEGHGQTYSVLSLLQNIANHDREHAAQIAAVLSQST